MEKNEHKLNTKQWRKLSQEERKIFNSLLHHYPATSHDYAYDVAIQGGVKHQFIPT